MAELQKLIRKRAIIKGSLTRFKNVLDALKPEDEPGQFLSRFASAEGLLERYEDVQMEIELLDEETDHEQDRILFEEEYHAAIGKAKDKVQFQNVHIPEKCRVTSRNSNASVQNSTATTTEVRLPVLNLPRFEGDYESWAGFKDTFNVLVNQNDGLSKVQKFYYLQSCLKGRAAETIGSLQISNENYTIAWNLLEERFQNVKLTVMAHVKSLVELPNVAKDNSVAIRQLLDEYLKHSRALKMLKQPVEAWGMLLIHLITAKLDINSRRYWEIETNSKDLPTLDQLEKFLKDRCQLLEIVNEGNKNNSKKVATMHTTDSARKLKCYYCKGEHAIFRCQPFLQMNATERKAAIDKVGICSLCFSGKHKLVDCKGRTCKKCNKRHNTLLHYQEATTSHQGNASQEEGNVVNGSNEITSHALGDKMFEEHVLLSTAKVKILDSKNKPVEVRALLDSGSTANYITGNIAKRLGLSCSKISPVKISGINNSQSRVTTSVSATVTSVDRSFRTELSFLILGKITEKLPIVSFNKQKIRIPSGVTLADPEFNISTNVDMLLGAQIFYDLFLSGRIDLESLTLRESKLGWLVTGSARLEISNHSSQQRGCLSVENSKLLQDSLERFWKTEELPSGNTFLTQEEAECEDKFESTTRRDSQGRFIVKYPMHSETLFLGDSLIGARNRFHSLEKRLQRNKRLHEEYSDFLREYETAGHMKKIGFLNEQLEMQSLGSNRECETLQKYYIPHHCVEKITSSTTKLRVVFDASAKSSNQVSLNAILQNGPVVQSDLFSILLRFRKYNVILSADIKQMFRQILVDEKQQGFQRILWRERQELPLQVYQLRTITYGLKPATYLATRCVKEAAVQFKDQYPQASRALIEDTYVDDFTSGAKDLETALLLKAQVDEILKSACFELRKWRSNFPGLLAHTDFVTSSEKHFIKDETEHKTLGLVWDSKNDTLGFQVLMKQYSNGDITKRLVLSLVSRIFDPLGLAGPSVILAKIFLQSLWLCKLTWDDRLPENLRSEWAYIEEQLEELNTLTIPRHALRDESTNTQLHGFADASEKAYGCAVYLRSVSESGEVTTRLLCSKSRVAPIKQLSLPRLELSAAVLLAKLTKVVATELKLEINSITYWTDSSIVLNWIGAHASTWKIFVANRVATIQELTQGHTWRHVRSEENPADIISRGILTTLLIQSTWWTGPLWLRHMASEWPQEENSQLKMVEVPERKNIITTLGVSKRDFTIFERFSSFKRLQRVTAWCKRFFYNLSLKRDARNKNSTLSSVELAKATTILLRLAQEQEFEKELVMLKGNKDVNKDSPILPLNPFLDNEGVIRVGGRLMHSDFTFDKKFPIILPKKHLLTKLIVRYYHLKYLHLGANALLSSIREEFWPLTGLNTVKGILKQCKTCFKFNPHKFYVKMGNLPRQRVAQSRPFSTVSLDYAGPFLIKESKLRNRKIIKVYICIFVCFSTKAMHLELISDLTTDAFLNALKRFVSRRGLPSELYSDNATNFVAADKDLKAFFQNFVENESSEFVKNYLAEHKIIWKFMPARSPHFGGLHESAVKSVKGHLKKVMHNTVFTIESIGTVLCQIEAILNSRPLYPLSNDPDDLSVLTPAHFLIGQPLTALPQQNITNVAENRLNQYQQIQHRVQSFWKRWNRDYLCTLQTRAKWRSKHGWNLQSGSLVLLMDENLPPQCWRLGRILRTHHGADGIVRVVDIKTSTGETSRGVNKVCPIFVEESDGFHGGSMDKLQTQGLHAQS